MLYQVKKKKFIISFCNFYCLILFSTRHFGSLSRQNDWLAEHSEKVTGQYCCLAL